MLLAQARRAASVAPKNGGSSIFEHSVLIMAKNRVLPGGTEQLMVVGPGTPTRNHTEPNCPTLQSATGLVVAVNEKNHCHHRAVHSAYVIPCACAWDGMTPGLEFCARAGITSSRARASTEAKSLTERFRPEFRQCLNVFYSFVRRMS